MKQFEEFDCLRTSLPPSEKLALGSREYKVIIEADQELCDGAVMEMMWGIKNPMHSLVPQELKVLTKEECLPMSKGMEMVLHRHKFDVKPEMFRMESYEASNCPEEDILRSYLRCFHRMSYQR